MKYLVAGPSHTARWKQRISWKQFVQPQNMKYLYFEAAGAIFSKKMEQFIKKNASEVEMIYLFVPDFRFGNDVLKEVPSSELFFDGFISTNKELISLENDQKLYAHALKVLDYYQDTYGSKIKFIFWCLNYRESQNKKNNKYLNTEGKYAHPVWNISTLTEKYTNNVIDISSLQPRIQEFSIDNQGHPSLKAYIFLHHLFRISSFEKALKLVDTIYPIINDFLFIETKEQLFNVKNYLEDNESLYHFSTSDSMVEMGKDNWLFLTNDSNHELRQHQGLSYLSFNQLNNIEKVWKDRKLFFLKSKIALEILIIPNKRTIYHEYMKNKIPLSEHRPVMQLLKVLKNQNINYTHPLEYMQKKVFLGERLFDKIDTHWNGLGAYRTYENLFLKNTFIKEEDLDFFKVKASGDLGGKLTPVLFDEKLYYKIKDPSSKEVFDNQVSNKGRMRIFKNTDESLPSLVIYGDSFCQIFLPLLAEHYSKLIFIHSTYINYSFIQSLNPDRVMIEMVERFTINHPQNDLSEHDIFFDILNKYQNNLEKLDEILGNLLTVKEEHFDISMEIDVSLSLAYFVNKDYVKSLAIVQSLIQEMPDYSLLDLLKNILYLKLEKYEEISLDENFTSMKLFYTLDFSKNEIIKYMNYDDKNPLVYFLLLRFYLKNNLLVDFETLKNDIQSQKMNFSYINHILGSFYFSKKQYEKSLFYLEKVSYFFQHHDIFLKIGISNFYLRNFNKSKEALLLALNIEANNYKIYFYLALSYMQLGEFGTSLNMFKDALRLEPKDESLLIQMSVLYRKNNDFKEQEVYLRKVLALNRENKSALKEYGKLLFQQKKYTESKNILAQLEKQDNEVTLILSQISKKIN